jgi:hypothetical protein
METFKEQIDWLQANLQQLNGKEQLKLAKLVSAAQARLDREFLIQECHALTANHAGRARDINRYRQVKKPGRTAPLADWQEYADDTAAAVRELEAAIARGQEIGHNLYAGLSNNEEALAVCARLSAQEIADLNLAFTLFENHRIVRLSTKSGKRVRSQWLRLLRQRLELRAAA